MEVSLDFLIETPNKKLADFIGLMWDEDNAPVEIDEVESTFHQAFKALEFIDIPQQTRRVSDKQWLCFYDAINDGEVSDILKPYYNIGIERLIVVCSADEGAEWYSIDNNGYNHISSSASKVEGIDEDDYFARLIYLASC